MMAFLLDVTEPLGPLAPAVVMTTMATVQAVAVWAACAGLSVVMDR